jgi:nucleoside-diphosphate-sugar epimerase
MKILVTGSSGVIASDLLPLLYGSEVLAVDRVLPETTIPGVRYVQANICGQRIPQIEEFNPDVVFHLAASFERTEESPDFLYDNWRDNIECFHYVATATKPKMFVFASSYLVYRKNNDFTIGENDPIEPRNICGAAKFYAEQELDFVHKHINPSGNYINARIFRSFGRGSRDVVSRWIRAAIKNDPIEVYNPNNSFDYIYAGDVAEALYRLSLLNYSGVVNVGRGVETSIQGLIGMIGNKNAQTINDDIPALQENTCANVSKLLALTGWRPKTLMRDTIARIFEYEQYRRKNG